MKKALRTVVPIYDLLEKARDFFLSDDSSRKYTDEAPLRSELLSAYQMEQRGKKVAAYHKLQDKRTPDQLLKRLDDNEKILIEVRNLLVESIKEQHTISPAGEWLLDNFYLLEEHIVIARKHLPKDYSQTLPILANKHAEGLPRVYDIALEIISHSDGRVDLRSLSSFASAYQSVNELSLGELWAIPIMLRLALIENLRRVASRVALDKIDQNIAAYWADKMINVAEKNSKDIILIVADMARSNPRLSGPFVGEYLRKLQAKGSAFTLPINWMVLQLAELGLNAEEMIHIEGQNQAVEQVSVSNSINSLRFLETTNWGEFVETMSVVEQTLREDQGGVYGMMDFATRDNYRHVIERIAKKSTLSEVQVAATAIALAKEAAVQHAEGRKAHVGYYLIDKGVIELQKRVGMERSVLEQLKQAIQRFPLTVYLGSIFSLSLSISIITGWFAWHHQVPVYAIAVLFFLALFASSQLAISMVNWISTLIVPPKPLPRMDFAKHVPHQFKTLVTIPTLLTNEKAISDLLEALEVRYLANKIDHVYYSLLTDFTDAATEHLPADDKLLQQVMDGIHLLNEKYSGEQEQIFYLFHRQRNWNEKEKAWMGYERKRGKLSSLNHLLRGNPEGFSHVVGDVEKLSNIKYVITLDTDTNMPRETAWQMIATMAHPLNKALFDDHKGRVVEGYGILQPRVAVSLPGTTTTFFERMHSIDTGLDPYTHMISDVYQDLFGEGSFIGKGIYDVDVFERALADTFPENRILSHDLLEGCYARSGLLSDVKLYENYPLEYHADVKRIHRWIRGDWQIATWALPIIRGGKKHFHKNNLSALSRWKIFDNLRRSLVAISCVLLLVIAWILLPRAGTFTLIVLSFIFLPVLFTSFWQLFHKSKEIDFKQHLKECAAVAEDNLAQLLLRIATLPYEAYYSADAIFRTIWRLLISRKHLLEWTPFGVLKTFRGLATSYVSMWIGPLLAIVLFIYLTSYKSLALSGATAILFLWLIAPAMTWWISRPIHKKPVNLSTQQKLYLHKLARRTWSFFERFVTEDDNWLPPDNYQEAPREALAHRTSPTNIGLSLLANLAAYDFGFITRTTLLERTKNTFNTLKKLERFRGHFLNWYDTQTLKPLHPRYISSVDSGNLAGHLLILKQGLSELKASSTFNRKIFFGLRNTLLLANDEDESISKNVLFKALLKRLNGLCDMPPHDLTDIQNALEESLSSSVILLNQLRDQKSKAPDWLREFNKLADDALREMQEGYDLPSFQQHDLITLLVKDCDVFSDMEYAFLYNPSKHLLRIGYNLDEHRPDESYYDLLASEARLGTYVAISQGKLPQESWFALGRLLTRAGGDPILLSWSGSMFEYLMPNLVMPSYSNTLLDQTVKTAVARQIDFGLQKNIPWGISESGYNAFDANLNYQYRAFGVPGLGLKRGLGDDMVIAPYATMLGLMFAPQEAYHNLKIMQEEEFSGEYGFYEAIDYTASRLPRAKNLAVVQSYMAHHQGMGFLSMAYILLNQPMQKRFSAEPQLQSSLLLLQERIPRANIFHSHTSDITEHYSSSAETNIRMLNTPDTPIPEIQLLTNSRYNVMVSNSGGGYSKWKNYAITRWREDATRDHHGSFCYIKDVEKDIVWSNTYQPTLQKADNYEAVFSLGKVEFYRVDRGFTTRTEIIVSPEDDVEIRRIRISNHAQRARTLELTSYAEVVIADPNSDAAHPAFSNLFVQTEILKDQHAILCTRRPRSENEASPWMFHLMEAQGCQVIEVSYETDRMKFTGRTNTTQLPRAVKEGGVLSGSDGSVLDPIVSIRYLVTLKPNQSCSIDLVYGAASKKDDCNHLIQKYQDRSLRNRAFELSWTHSQVVLRQINATEADAQLYGKLASAIIYPYPLLRTEQNIIISNHQGQPALWKYSISGDLPIVLLRVQDAVNIQLVQQMIQAHTYWRLKGLAVDLVIWNEDHGSYRQELLDRITNMITSLGGAKEGDRQGGIYVRSAEQVSNEDRILFQTLARAILYDDKGTLSDQIQKKYSPRALPPLLEVVKETDPPVYYDATSEDVHTENGYGTFSEDGREYIIVTDGVVKTPAPWVNVLANPHFGSIVSESGAAYTWAVNAHAYRLSPWHNDAVSDNSGEAFYIRDEVTGDYWSLSSLPVKSDKKYITRHGFGYSVFSHREKGIASEMIQFVDIKEPVKYILIKIRNESDTERSISLTGYIEWILADMKSKSTLHLINELHSNKTSLLAYNHYNLEFGERVAFLDISEQSNYSYTTDRAEFLGRNGNLQMPEALKRTKLSGKLGAGYDACAAMQVILSFHPSEEKEIVFRIGSGRDRADSDRIISQQKGIDHAKTALDNVKAFWNKHLNSIQVHTPDRALNIMTNGWLSYQTLSSRIWGRSGYYQSGGAFGFRDQLQDVLSLLHSDPEIAKAQILLCASRQFREGDVQHWWHPPSGRGVRTRCSDDYLWLPYVTGRYIKATGDIAILGEYATYIEGRQLYDGEESYYDLPMGHPHSESLYHHCVQAIRYGLKFGEHGLPLIGSGDWNDGMDKVGIEGKGESVWLGFFLYDVLTRFGEVARQYDDEAFATECKEQAETLSENLNRHAWDGEWYRRAYFDNGSPLGSRENDECRIDSISQSWSVLSGVADQRRAASAMQAVDKHLVNRKNKLIQLLDPPFDKTTQNPGYIKGYVPGVRENGGQYTHAAIWTIMAFAEMGENEKAWELFRMINPVNHGATKESIAKYKVEPYVAVADIYAMEPHGGRGGWTWYTGSAGWMYQLILHSILGLRIEGDRLFLKPCIPADWDKYSISYTYKHTVYNISVSNHHGDKQTFHLDGNPVTGQEILLMDDGIVHTLAVEI
ncbi:MAG TPA: glucoamylase family protein [Flavipsychrobacter sp.]|nr:glucoamylase family protein [Flavipsychrobacter sp.]